MTGLDIQFAFEPGRMIAANAGLLLARVIHVTSDPKAAASWSSTRP
jgi:diaminopimelate decarboxylase